MASRHKDIVELLLFFAKPLLFVDILLLLPHVRQHLTVPVSCVVHLHLRFALLLQHMQPAQQQPQPLLGHLLLPQERMQLSG